VLKIAIRINAWLLPRAQRPQPTRRWQPHFSELRSAAGFRFIGFA